MFKRKFNLKNIFSVIMLLTISAIFYSCGNDEVESKSMTQIQEEEGIPVEVETITEKPFTKYLSFFSKLKGIKEATKGAAIGGKIEKINYRIGDYVKEGTVVVQFPSDTPGLQFEQSKIAYENAKKNFERMKALLDAGETSQANYDGAETQYLVAKGNYESQKQMLFVEAPFDGYIVDINVNEGDNVKGDSHLFTVAQLNRMRAEISVSEKEINQIKKGMSAVVDISGKEYKGKVTEVSMAMDPYKQAFNVDVEFDNSSKELKSGITTDVKLLIYENPQAIIIPRNLVKKDDKGIYVFLEKDGTAEKRYIKNGKDSGLNFEVSTGLKPGENLIIKGAANLENGSKVKVI